MNTEYHNTPKETIQEKHTRLFVRDASVPILPRDFGLDVYGMYESLCAKQLYTRKELYYTCKESKEEIDRILDILIEAGFVVEVEVRQ